MVISTQAGILTQASCSERRTMAGKNMEIRKEGNKLIIEVDLSQSQGLSKSEKSEVIATSAGAMAFEGVQVNLNVYKPRTA